MPTGSARVALTVSSSLWTLPLGLGIVHKLLETVRATLADPVGTVVAVLKDPVGSVLGLLDSL